MKRDREPRTGSRRGEKGRNRGKRAGERLDTRRKRRTRHVCVQAERERKRERREKRGVKNVGFIIASRREVEENEGKGTRAPVVSTYLYRIKRREERGREGGRRKREKERTKADRSSKRLSHGNSCSKFYICPTRLSRGGAPLLAKPAFAIFHVTAARICRANAREFDPGGRRGSGGHTHSTGNNRNREREIFYFLNVSKYFSIFSNNIFLLTLLAVGCDEYTRGK